VLGYALLSSAVSTCIYRPREAGQEAVCVSGEIIVGASHVRRRS
jgi:hypothetical protein